MRTKLPVFTRSLEAVFFAFFLSAFCSSFLAIDAIGQTLQCQSKESLSLSLVYPERSALDAPFHVSFSLLESLLKVHFEIRTPSIFAKEKLGENEFPYQFDVVELFISTTGVASENYPYFEFEVSPYNQTFQVRVPGAKKRFEEGLNLGLKSRTEFVAGGWNADVELPLEPLAWKGTLESLVGNAYGILGENPSRTYWSLSLPKQKKPNFHHPEFFKQLFSNDECK